MNTATQSIKKHFMTTLEKINKAGYDLKFIGGNNCVVSRRNGGLFANGRESVHSSPTAALKYIKAQY